MARVVRLRRGDVPDHADAGLSARSRAELEKRRIDIDGKDYAYQDQLAWPGLATLPGSARDRDADRLAPEGLPVGVQIIGP